MEFSIDILNVRQADAIIIWGREDNEQYVIFLDGGYSSDGARVLSHYDAYIRPHIGDTPHLIVINSHPHDDHIGGLTPLVEGLHALHQRIAAVYVNNPDAGGPLPGLHGILQERMGETTRQQLPLRAHQQLLQESINRAEAFSATLQRLGIPTFPISAEVVLPGRLATCTRILGPSPHYYWDCMLKAAGYKHPAIPETELLLEQVAATNPCQAVDRASDPSYENRTSVILELTDSRGRNYLFTGDASVPALAAVEQAGIAFRDYHLAQLPHHGSWANINRNWLNKLSPRTWWASAPGRRSHPHQALLSCLKQAKPNGLVYSTHNGGDWLRFASDFNAFPPRQGTRPATPL